MSKATHYATLLVLPAILGLSLASCGEGFRCASSCGVLGDGAEDRASLSFPMNRKPVRLELFLRLDGGKALVTIDHPDGRTTESFPVEGEGVHELRTELPKEPGSWGLGLASLGGEVTYWYALHDSTRFLGPDDAARRVVGAD